MRKDVFMRKNIRWLLPVVFCGIAICISCNIISFASSSGESTYDAPEVKSETTGITCSIHPLTNASYINIFRQKITTSSSSEKVYGAEVNIGELKPYDGSTFPDSIMFSDQFAYVTTGVTYRYKARYRVSSAYKTSEWSEALSGAVTNSSGYTVVYSGSGVYFKYDPDLYTLTLSGALTAPTAATFTPKIALTTSSESSVFKLAGVAVSNVFYLRNVLPSSYLDTAVTVTGVIGELKTLYPNETSPTYIQYYWTEPLTVPVYESDDTNLYSTLTTITISSAGSETTDVDYSSSRVGKTGSTGILTAEYDYTK
jgi:hypothetical protein